MNGLQTLGKTILLISITLAAWTNPFHAACEYDYELKCDTPIIVYTRSSIQFCFQSSF